MRSFAEYLAMENDQSDNVTVDEALNLDNSETPSDAGEPVDSLIDNDEGDAENTTTDASDTSDSASDTGEDTGTDGDGDDSLLDGDDTNTDTAEEGSEPTDTAEGEQPENTDGTPEEGEGESEPAEPATDDDAGGEEPSEDDLGTDEEPESEEPTEEEKEEAADALESIRDHMLKSINAGGLDESAVTVANLAITHALSKVGLANKRITASTENFAERSSRRLLATNQAIDNLNYFIDVLRTK